MKRDTKRCGNCKKYFHRHDLSYPTSDKVWATRRFCMEKCHSLYRSSHLKDNPNYFTIHLWLRKTYGNADKCVNDKCLGKSNNFEYALKKKRNHARRKENYIMLCRPCHSKYDNKRPSYETSIKLSESSRLKKLNKEQVLELRKLYDDGKENEPSLARIYGTTQTNVSHIILRKTWKYV